MASCSAYDPVSVIPAALLPFHNDFSIDERGLKSHLKDLAAVEGISAIALNAHASEVASLTVEEQQRVFAIAQDAVGDKTPLIHGIWADGSIEAARIAKLATASGASALLVFPPAPFTLGQTPDMVLTHFKRIADVTELPLIVFQYPLATGQGYPLDTLLRLVEEVPTIRAVKDWCADPMLHETHIYRLQGLPRPINVLTAHTTWLLGSVVLGCSGILSGSGSVVADLHVALFRAVKSKELSLAQKINERLYFLNRIFYAQPWIDMHNRMKHALVLLGRMKSAVVRPPLVGLKEVEVERIRAGLVAAGLLDEARSHNAA